MKPLIISAAAAGLIFPAPAIIHKPDPPAIIKPERKPIIPAVFPFPVFSPISASYTPMTWYAGTQQIQLNDASARTFTAVPLGAEATGGLVVVLITWGTTASQAFNSCTIDGQTATYTETHQSLVGAAIAYATGVTGTTCDIAVSTGLSRRMIIQPFVLFPTSTTPLDIGSNTFGTGLSLAVSDIAVQAGGVAFSCCTASTTAVLNFAYSGTDTMTEYYNASTAEAVNVYAHHGGAITEDATTNDFTYSTPSQNRQWAIVAASWV
jgi:hypothetical protein